MSKQFSDITSKQPVSVNKVQNDQPEAVRVGNRIVIKNAHKLRSNLFRFLIILVKASGKRLQVFSNGHGIYWSMVTRNIPARQS